MSILCLGLSYRTAPVELRESVNFTPELLTGAYTYAPAWLYEQGLQELVILSTCNRMEVYASTYREDTAAGDKLSHRLAEFIAHIQRVPATRFYPHLYHYTGTAAVEHLCRVAAGLDSMVLGESQILGQVAEAFHLAQAHQAAGPTLMVLFQTAIRCGKRARTETSIGRNPASVSSAAVWLAQTIVHDLATAQVLLIGAGEMGQLALKALRQRDVQQINIINRTYQHAAALAAQWGGTAQPLEQLLPLLLQADVVVTSTGAPHPIIDATTIQQVMAQRTVPLVLIDIAVPRDIAPEAGRIAGVHLFDLDALQNQADESLTERQQAVPQVLAIIREEAAVFQKQLQALAIRPVIVDLRQRAETIRRQELDRARRFLPDVDEATWQHIEHLSLSLVNKLLHEPTVRLRHEAGNGSSADFAETVRHLFGLEEPH